MLSAANVELNALVQVVQVTDDREAALRELLKEIPTLPYADAASTPFLAIGHDYGDRGTPTAMPRSMGNQLLLGAHDRRLPARDRTIGPAHPLEHQPLVGGMLVDEDEAVLRLGDDIGGGDLAAGDSEREALGFRRRREGGFAAGLGGRSRSGFASARSASGGLGAWHPQAKAASRRAGLPDLPSPRPLRGAGAALPWHVRRRALDAPEAGGVERVPAARRRSGRGSRPGRGSGPRSWRGGR